MEDNFYSRICIIGFVILLLLSVVAIIANGLLLFVLYLDPLKCFRNNSAIFIASLATLDFLSGVLSGFCAPSWVKCIEGKTKIPEFASHLAIIPFQISVTAAIFVVLLFSFSRLMVISFPFHYRRFVNAKRSFISVLTVFVFSIFLVLVQLFPGVSHDAYVFVFIHLYITFPFVLLLVTNTALIIALRKSKKQRIHLSGRSPNNSRARAKRSKAERTLACTGVMVVIIFSVALIPFYVFVLVQKHCPSCRFEEWYFAGRRLSLTFVLTNSAVNPFLYFFLLPKYRRAVWRMCMRLMRRQRAYMGSGESRTGTSEQARYKIVDTRV